jgi:hypothetical protein
MAALDNTMDEHDVRQDVQEHFLRSYAYLMSLRGFHSGVRHSSRSLRAAPRGLPGRSATGGHHGHHEL